MTNKLSTLSSSLNESQKSELSTLKEHFNLSLIEQLNFFSQDGTDEGKEKGYDFFKKIEKLIQAYP